MRSAEPRAKVDAWPCPPGIVAGMPSAMRRMPRTPNVARTPKPREEICRSWA
jgi:hypothetical protein